MILFITQTTKPLEPSKETIACEYTATVTTKHKRVKLKNHSPKKSVVYCLPQSTNRRPTVSQQMTNSGPTNDQQLSFNFILKKKSIPYFTV